MNESRLRSFIRSLLIESFHIDSSKKLDEAILALKKELQESDNKDADYMSTVYNDLLISLGFELIDDTGLHRLAYSSPESFFVVKIARGDKGADVNKSEVGISSGDHSLETRDMFVDVYDYDKISASPHWIVSEKVIPLKSVNNIDDLNKIFPTFYKATRGMIDDPEEFKEFLQDVISEGLAGLGLPSRSGFDFSKLSKEKHVSGKKVSPEKKYFSDIDSDEVKYRAMYPKLSSNSRLIDALDYFWEMWLDDNDMDDIELDLSSIDQGEDIKRLASCFKYSTTADLHFGNLAVRYSKNISPKDLVILDLEFDNKEFPPPKEYGSF